ncbi:TRAF3-interacting protein 1 [Caerostris extrusa]|uniref:TRAF3-interacting protein 1 n=1 Tax=Caerostris extrusa TaxID=172846 RepID=A0AAV4UUI5_CAEEX|nr:TRAF3-interacting protein 1 [Caerostris extrusa]
MLSPHDFVCDFADKQQIETLHFTQLGKPALTEKSLKKPPFRFLHDIITNVIKSTGFCKGLYTASELQSENVKDKESKIQFLQKAVDVLSLVTNHPVNLKPSKVLDSKEAVEEVLNGKTQTSPTKALKERRASLDRRGKGANEKSHSRSLTKTLDPVKKKKLKMGKSKREKIKKERERSKERAKHKTEGTKKPTKEKSPRLKTL